MSAAAEAFTASQEMFTAIAGFLGGAEAGERDGDRYPRGMARGDEGRDGRRGEAAAVCGAGPPGPPAIQAPCGGVSRETLPGPGDERAAHVWGRGVRRTPIARPPPWPAVRPGRSRR